MRRPGGRPAAFDGYASADAVARGPASVLFRLHGLRGRDVALKVFRTQEQGFPRTRMLGDWRIWSKLAHPHVLPVSDFGERNDSLYVATPWVDGPSLRAVLDQRRTLDPAEIRELARQLASALDAAAAVRLIHLDVKPENVLFAAADRTVHAYVRDFGAGSLASSARGTLEYAAPEQVTGRAVDGRALVYSLGCLLYETLTGATPYAGRSRDALVRAHLEEKPPLVEGAPGEVDRVLARALAKRRDDRYATCTDFAEALCGALALMQAPRPARETTRRRFGVRQLTVAASLALVVSAVATTVSWVTAGAPGVSAPAADKPLSSREFFALIRAGRPAGKSVRRPLSPAAGAARVSTRKPEAARPERHAVSATGTAHTSASGTAASAPSTVARHASVVAAPTQSAGSGSSSPATTTPAAAPAAAPPPPPPPPSTDPTTPPLPPPPP